MERKLKILIILNSIILIVCSLTCFVRILTNLIKKREHDKRSYLIFEIIVLILSIINSTFGLSLAIDEQKKVRDHQLNCKMINFLHLILNLICAILFSFFFFIEFIRWCRDLLNDNQINNDIRLLIIIFALIIGLCQIVCAIQNRILAWSPKYRYSRFVLCFSSTILLAISIVSIILNIHIRHLQEIVKRSNIVPFWYYTIFEGSSSYTLLCGLVGITLTFLYGRKDSGPNQFRKRLGHLFTIFCTIGLVLIVIFTILLLSYHTKVADKNKVLNIYTLKHSNLFVSIVQCILLLLIIRSLHNLVRATRSGRNDLTIERIRLSQISSAYVTHWTKAIDQFNLTPEGMTGDAALQLMIAYENGQLENIECVVLRIGRSGRRILLSNNQWDDTEALVLLTIVHNYDVTSGIRSDSFWNKILKRTLDSKSCNKRFHPFSLRLGLIGYQWPFRTSIFFTSPHRDPLTRAAHVLETIIDWNEMQKSKIHSDVLLLPTLNTEFISKAIPIAGFFSLPLPSTHLLDLRPHRGKTWNEYIKTLKKGNRRPYIQQFITKGGTIEQVKDLTLHELGKTVCHQWENIARIRRENKEPPTFAKPSPEFITSMGNAMNDSYRSVVLLRFNNEVIASSVIYKFPHKLITTDIQGLTHEKARPLKAYFVMLQWIIKEALDNKYDFVDFGPTTPGPKIDLGCTSVPLEAGGYVGNPILAFAIQQAGNTVHIIHTKNDNQQSNSSHQIGKDNDQLHLDTQLTTDNNELHHQTLSNDSASTNYPKKQIKNIEKMPSVNIDNETRPTVLPMKKVNPSKNKNQIASNSDNSSRENPTKNKQDNDESDENQSIHRSTSFKSIKTLDIVPQSNNSPVKETLQLQKSISTDTVIIIFP